MTFQELVQLIKLRLYAHDFEWNLKSRLIDKGCNQAIDSSENHNKSFYKRLSECRLCITTYNATTFLETFSVNYPTLLYWDPKYFEIREDAKTYYNMLEDVGILHYTPASLVLKLEEIYEKPMKWWKQESIQKAKDEFCKRFANSENSFVEDYKMKINEVING